MTDEEPEPTKVEVQCPPPILDPSLYNMRSEDAAFFKKMTGIKDDETLKQHVLDVQAKAYKATTP
jgi:hypothetical protein